MLTYVITLLVFLAIFAAMSIGVMMGRKPISGSCGGIGAALGEEDYVCDFCGGDPKKCDAKTESTTPAASGSKDFYEASR